MGSWWGRRDGGGGAEEEVPLGGGGGKSGGGVEQLAAEVLAVVAVEGVGEIEAGEVDQGGLAEWGGGFQNRGEIDGAGAGEAGFRFEPADERVVGGIWRFEVVDEGGEAGQFVGAEWGD